MNAEERLVRFGDSQKKSESSSYCEACLPGGVHHTCFQTVFSQHDRFLTKWPTFVRFMLAKAERKENASFRLFLTSFGCFGCFGCASAARF